MGTFTPTLRLRGTFFDLRCLEGCLFDYKGMILGEGADCLCAIQKNSGSITA